MTKDAAGAVFAALADPTRRRVVHELSKDGPLTATELARRIPVSRQAIAKHFDALEEAGLAAATRVGRETRYELRTRAFAEAEAWMCHRGDVGSAPRRVQGVRGVGAFGLDGKEGSMIGSVHPEVSRSCNAPVAKRSSEH